MHILITGITGLFGSYLAKEFSSLGIIHGLKRKSSEHRLLENLDFDIVWHEGDVLDPESIAESLKGIDLVIHSAGVVSFDPKEKDLMYEVNVRGTSTLVNVMLDQGVKNLIHVSSVAAIGRSAEIMSVSEDYKWTQSPLNTDYSISKYWAEMEAWRGSQEGLNLLVVNPSILLAKVNDKRSSTQIYNYLFEGRHFYPSGNVNYIDIRDAAHLVSKLFQDKIWGERFILSKESLPYKDFFERMGEEFQIKAPNKRISTRLLKVLLFFNSLASLLGLGSSILSRQTALIAQQKVFFDNGKIEKQFEFKYKSLKETLSWAK